MREHWAVACKWWLINRSIAGKMNYLAKCVSFNGISPTTATIVLGWVGQRAGSQSCRKAMNNFRWLWMKWFQVTDCEWKKHYTEHWWSIHNDWSCTHGNWKVILLLLYIANIFAAIIGKIANNRVTSPFWEWASTDPQRFLGVHLD